MYKRKEINWSCKHSVLLRNADGTLSPMDEPYYRSEQVAPGTWKVLSAGDYSWLVEGEREAVSIDTGYGAGNIREYLQTLTDRPVRNVINTHSHFDHTANNGYFEAAYMAQAAIPLATVPYRSFSGIRFIENYKRIAVEEGFLYDLGGRALEVFSIPDHTVDGIALLDRRERLMFTGDEFMPQGKKLNVSVATFYGYLRKLLAHRHEFDRICAGSGVLDAALIDNYEACAARILSGYPGKKEAIGPRMNDRLPPGPNGEIVYDRMRPHPGDSAGGGKPSPKELYVMEYAGAKIIYDINNIGEK